MKQFILVILLSACASALGAEQAREGQEKSFLPPPSQSATEQQWQSYLLQAQSAVASAKAKSAKVDSPVNESLVKGPAIVPEMVRVPGKDYEIGKYEVTQAEWVSVMGNNPSKFKNCGDTCPVERVSWDDVQIYIQRLYEKTGKQFRLPTEAEWEYACYGGSQSEFCGGDNVDPVAWTDDNAKDTTHPVGQKKANGYGLYDMSGNVMEWTNDCWEGNCAQRVFRGGSWMNYSRDGRVSYRIRFNTSIRNFTGGFRLVRKIP
jgi:formylglycine-generating enzyme required for sulfatase activity